MICVCLAMYMCKPGHTSTFYAFLAACFIVWLCVCVCTCWAVRAWVYEGARVMPGHEYGTLQQYLALCAL